MRFHVSREGDLKGDLSFQVSAARLGIFRMSLPEKEPPPGPVIRTSSEPGKKSSWVSIVNNKPSLSQHDVEVALVDGSESVEIPDAVIQNSVPLWEDFLEGRFLAPAPHVAKIHVIVNKIWPLGDKTVRIDVFEVNTTTVKFRIKNEGVRLRLLRRGMWNIADIPMILSKWSPLVEEEEPEIKIMPMWITLKNVPHKMFSWDGLGFLASAVGKPVRLHPDTELCSSFEEAKVFVEADMKKELPKKYRFTSSTMGIDAVVEFSYPWLPHRCNHCSKWGHLEKQCVGKGGDKQVCILKQGVQPKAVAFVEDTQKSEMENLENKGDETEVVVVESATDLMAAVKDFPPTEIVSDGAVTDLRVVTSADPLVTKIQLQESHREEDMVKTPTEGHTTSSLTLSDSTEGWSVVSPTRRRSTGENQTLDQRSIGSPSCFAVLIEDDILNEDKIEKVENDEEDKIKVTNESYGIREEVEEAEEGEICHKEKEGKKGLQSETRKTLPRQSKGSNRKYRSEQYVLNKKESLLNVMGKKKSKKT